MDSSFEFIGENTLVVDIHNFRVLEAKYYLERLIKEMDISKYDELIIIHGYNKGQNLKIWFIKILEAKGLIEKLITGIKVEPV